MTKAIVIGAGVIGASIAFGLAEAGAEVIVLEAGRIGGGTSGISFAWVNSRNKPPKAYHDLNVAGMKAHLALSDRFGAAPWLHRGGAFEWTTAQEYSAQVARVEQLQSWGYAAEWITPAQLHNLEPDVDLASVGDQPVAYYAEEGWVDPVLYAHAMLMAATARHGARVLLQTPVTEIVMAGDRVIGVRTTEGTRHEADIVVNCAGRWANGPVRESELHLPLAPTVGLLVFTPPVATSLSHVVHSPWINMRPDGAGRLMLHWDAMDETVSIDTPPSVSMPQARDLAARASRVLSWIGDVAPEAARIAVRPIPRDHFSAVGLMPRVKNYYLAVTHSGVTLSPFLGQAVADEIIGGRQWNELAAFRPARFFN